MKIGVYVGSFNPVHIGHIKIANELINKNYVDKIYIIPTENYWNKQDLISLHHRINMLNYFEADKVIIDKVHNKYPYTYQILNDLRKVSNDEFYLIIGADNLEKFHLWKNANDILNNKIIVINRNNIDCSKYTKKFKTNNFTIINDIDEINISSTMIRENKDYRDKYLDKRVLDYINNNNLYED